MAAAAPSGPGSTRRAGRARLDLGHHRRCVGAGEKRGSLTGPNPVDRGKPGSKLHILSEAQGIPLIVGVSAANTHDSQALKPLVLGLPAIRSRRGPRRRRPSKLRGDKAYHSADHLSWLRERGIVPRIARPGIETSTRLGRHRWKIERTIAWTFGYRRLTIRYERERVWLFCREPADQAVSVEKTCPHDAAALGSGTRRVGRLRLTGADRSAPRRPAIPRPARPGRRSRPVRRRD
uniref:transposase n=1 Tax=Streptacidiphilus albus TaxID=105425 RepID=UPI0018CF5E5F